MVLDNALVDQHSSEDSNKKMVPTVSPTATLVLTAALVMNITAKTTWSPYLGLVDIEGSCNLEVALTAVVHSEDSLVHGENHEHEMSTSTMIYIASSYIISMSPPSPTCDKIFDG